MTITQQHSLKLIPASKVFERRLRCLILIKSTKAEVDEAHTAFETSLAFAKLDDSKKDKLRLELSELVDGRSKPGQISVQVHLPMPAEEVPVLADSKPNLPALSSAVSIKFEVGRGRFAVANREILAGSLLLVEKPFVSCLDVEQEEDHCHHCLVNCPLRQLPCQGCVRARYCSSKCRQAARVYHHFECGVKDPMVALLGKLRQDGQEAAARRRDFHRCKLFWQQLKFFSIFLTSTGLASEPSPRFLLNNCWLTGKSLSH